MRNTKFWSENLKGRDYSKTEAQMGGKYQNGSWWNRMGREGAGWMPMAQERDQWRYMVMNLQVPWVTMSFSGRTLLHGVSQLCLYVHYIVTEPCIFSGFSLPFSLSCRPLNYSAHNLTTDRFLSDLWQDSSFSYTFQEEHYGSKAHEQRTTNALF